MPVDVERLKRERTYETRAPLENVASDLAQMEGLAGHWKAARRQLQFWGAVAIATGVLGIAVWAPLGLAAWAAAFYLFYRVKRFPKAFANHADRCAFARSVAGWLAADAKPGAEVAIRVAFDPQPELLSEGPLAHRRDGQQRLFKTTWFSLETELHDGTTLLETIDDLVRTRTSRNARGKAKTKTRTRSLVAMRLAYPSAVYGDASALAGRLGKEMQLPASGVLRGAEVTERAVKVKAMVKESGDLARANAMLALGVYRTLNLARELEARRGGQKRAAKP